MNGQPPNGAPRIPVMNPQERMLWLASHRAPPYFRLVTTAEMAIVEAQMRRAVVYEVEFRATIAELDRFGYWSQFPDVKTAAANAAFDARRHERATAAAIERLEKTEAFLKTLMAAPSLGPIAMIDVINEHGLVQGTLAFLRQQAAAKLEVKPEAPPRG